MQQTYYLYRFLDRNDNVIYIGRTNNIERRILKEHFTPNTHIVPECYLEVEKVEYAEFEFESEEVAYEAILINQLHPKYNKQFKDNAKFDVNLPDIEWKKFNWEYPEQMDMMKMLKEDVVSVSDSTCDVLNQLLSSDSKDGLCFGISDVDKAAILTPSSMTMIAAPCETYKTSYALSIAVTNAIRNKKVLYINLKDSLESLTYRLISKESHVPLAAIQRKYLTEENWKAITVATSILNKLPISFYNSAVKGCKIEDIGSIIREEIPDLVIIDDLNSIENFEASYDTDKTLRAMKSLKGIAIETQCPIISLYCLNSREINRQQEKRPSLFNLEYSSLLSYNDNIQFICTNNDMENGSRNSEIIVVKSSIFATGTIEVHAENGNLFEIEKLSN